MDAIRAPLEADPQERAAGKHRLQAPQPWSAGQQVAQQGPVYYHDVELRCVDGCNESDMQHSIPIITCRSIWQPMKCWIKQGSCHALR